MINNVFAPGCALLIYKLELAEKVLHVFGHKHPGLSTHKTCFTLNRNNPKGFGTFEPEQTHGELDVFTKAH